MKFLRAIQQQIYLLQLENYNVRRFFKGSLKLMKNPLSEQRMQIVWTKKLIIISLLSAVVASSVVLYVSFVVASLSVFWFIIFLFIFSYFVFCLFSLFLIFVVLITLPFDLLFKKIIVIRARRRIARLKNLVVIGITGSYGKTTIKEILTTVLQERFTVLKTPENINTLVGIARLILTKLDAKIDVFIVEMGAYKKGDIRQICDLVMPHIGVLAGINESHLERFGKIENTIAAKFEIVECLQQNGLAVLNADNELVMDHYKKYSHGKRVVFFSAQGNHNAAYTLDKKRFLPDQLRWRFFLANEEFELPLLGSYALGVFMACAIIAKELGMNIGEIKRGSYMIKPIAHRLDPSLSSSSVIIIDDGYNGNPRGAQEAIDTLKRFVNHRKVYVTPGLVELGKKSEEIHRHLALLLYDVVDVVVLIKNQRADFMLDELKKLGFSPERIICFSNVAQAHKEIGKVIQDGDVVLFQNDLPDNYLFVDN